MSDKKSELTFFTKMNQEALSTIVNNIAKEGKNRLEQFEVLIFKQANKEK